MSPRAAATSRARWPARRRRRPGMADRHQSAACSSAAATGCSMRAPSRPRCTATPSACPSATARFDCVTRRLRPAQHDAQGGGARRDGARAQARRPAGGARVLARCGSRCRARVRPLLVQGAALAGRAASRATPRPTAISPSRSACIPDQAALAAMMASAGLDRRRSIQPCCRCGRRASRPAGF